MKNPRENPGFLWIPRIQKSNWVPWIPHWEIQESKNKNLKFFTEKSKRNPRVSGFWVSCGTQGTPRVPPSPPPDCTHVFFFVKHIKKNCTWLFRFRVHTSVNPVHKGVPTLVSVEVSGNWKKQPKLSWHIYRNEFFFVWETKENVPLQTAFFFFCSVRRVYSFFYSQPKQKESANTSLFCEVFLLWKRCRSSRWIAGRHGHFIYFFFWEIIGFPKLLSERALNKLTATKSLFIFKKKTKNKKLLKKGTRKRKKKNLHYPHKSKSFKFFRLKTNCIPFICNKYLQS